MLNRYDVLKSRIISISMLIFICAIIMCSLSILLGHQDCSDWDAGNEDCWRNGSFHNLYKIGFILGAIAFLPALYKIFPKLWGSMKPFCEKILEFSILICVVLVPITIIIMFLYPNCYGDEVDYNELCTEGSLEYFLSLFIASCYLFLFIILVIRALFWIWNLDWEDDDSPEPVERRREDDGNFKRLHNKTSRKKPEKSTNLTSITMGKPRHTSNKNNPNEISSYMHKCESCDTMINQKKQLCKPCKRISNLPIERMNKGRDISPFTSGAISKKEKEFQKFKEWEQRAFERLRNPPRYPTAPNSEEEDYAGTDEQNC